MASSFLFCMFANSMLVEMQEETIIHSSNSFICEDANDDNTKTICEDANCDSDSICEDADCDNEKKLKFPVILSCFLHLRVKEQNSK